MGLVRHLFRNREAAPEPELPPAPWGRAPPDVTPATGSAQVPTPTPAPRSAPTQTPAPMPGSAAASVKERVPAPEAQGGYRPITYANCDAAGIVVELSPYPGVIECPLAHAQDFLNWLVTEPALAGKDVLEKILKQIYSTEFTRRRGRKPLPWESVLRRFRKMMGGPKTYKWVYKGGRRRRLRIYRIPLPPQQMVQAPGRQSETVA